MDNKDNKVEESMIEDIDPTLLVGSNRRLSYDERITYFTPAEQKKIVWKIDVRLVLTLGIMYCVSLMDRTNLGIAAVAGMNVDLQITGDRYSIVVLIFFITYVLLQPPATVILRKVGPQIFLPAITLLWGLAMIGFGFVKKKRNAVFYLIGSMASAFSGILAYGFSQLKNHGSGPTWWGQLIVPTEENPDIVPYRMPGISGWRWIFILQGVITCVVAIVAYFFVADFPENATRGIVKFLTQEECDFVLARIEKDRSDVLATEFKVGEYLKNALDLKVWGFATIFGLTTTSTYAISYFLPIILHDGMGFSIAAAQCLVAPPFVLAALTMFASAWYGDKWHLRSPFVILNGATTLVGIALLGYVENVGVRYFGVFLATSACNTNVPCILTWQANNIRGQWKRALCSATLVGFGGIGGIIGGTVFRTEDAPDYRPGVWACMGASALIVVISMLLVWKFHQANKRADAGGKIIEGLPGFRMSATNEPFYVRYYSGHSGKFGHEFLEFDFRVIGDGRSATARYANNSNYRNDSLIRKEMCVSGLMITEIKRIIKDSEIMKEDDSKWPQKNRDGRQELEIRLGNDHIQFETAKIGSLVDVTDSADPEGLRVFYYLVQDLKALVFSLISLHFKIKPI
ncbi:hypothetical protein DV738_g2781, partial [Chaetothyriales sp. CBS 135597]